MKFIHAADLHIDSPLRGLESYEGAPLDRLRRATRTAFENLIDLCLEENVDFLLIAGDMFDGQWPDMTTGVWTAGQFRRLAQENIPVFLIRGNHDAASQVRQAVTWPETVREFSVRKPESFEVAGHPVVIHGQGFPNREVPEDLARNYPNRVDGMFNIGLLHTSLTGDDVDHPTYAPTTQHVLLERDYDYWALGHIHKRSNPPISERPYIAYCGNTQGRHIKEQGEKGCLLVTVEDGHIDEVEFRATDCLRWHLAEIQLKEGDGLAELYEGARDRLVRCHQESGGRFSAVRIQVSGGCVAHRRLVDRAGREEAIAELRNLANELDEEIWVEKIELDTRAPLDLERLRAGTDLVGDMLRAIERLAESDEELAKLAEPLSALAERAPLELRRADIECDNPGTLRRWLRQAEGVLVAQLVEADE